jgi:chemotaxis methyl-accepting protein methylase
MNPPSDEEFNAILARASYLAGHDLQRYRREHLIRRFTTALNHAGLSRWDEFATWLSASPKAKKVILGLFPVRYSPGFFRDPAAFFKAERIIAEVSKESSRILVFSIGCGFGHEAYSLAIICNRCCMQKCEWSVIGIDMISEAIDFARRGIYPKIDIEAIDCDTSNSFFTPCGMPTSHKYEVIHELRNRCSFIQADLVKLNLKVPPNPDSEEENAIFSLKGNVDLIACRYVLTYLGNEAASDLLANAGLLLKSGGFLWIGEGETIVDEIRAMFEPVEPGFFVRK